jgi:hypothetical protein
MWNIEREVKYKWFEETGREGMETSPSALTTAISKIREIHILPHSQKKKITSQETEGSACSLHFRGFNRGPVPLCPRCREN